MAAGEAVGGAVHLVAQIEQRPVDPPDGAVALGALDTQSEVQVGQRVSVATRQ